MGPWAGLLSDEELLDGLRHMMTLRAFDARMLIAPAAGQDLVLHAAPRRGGASAARSQGALSQAT